MTSLRLFLFILLAAGLFAACRKSPSTLFTRLDHNESGVTFINRLTDDNPSFSILNYPYFYNGGGVAVGDLNNDSLPDLFFTGNMVKSGLFLNHGNLRFEDITGQSGITTTGWCSGVTLVDLNEDGWLDIYVCRSGLPNASDRTNLLYINNHNLTFTEAGAKYGLDDPGYSTQASFFDYDLDGDLDMFLINQSDPKFSRGYLDYIKTRTQKSDPPLGNKLYRNDGGHFTNVTAMAGIGSNVFTFSLGLSTTDINGDGWPDIYVANDFEEQDYLYINNGDGTFSDRMAEKEDHNSLFSMGVDIADYNNDQLPDIVVLDMLPEGNVEQKMHMGADNYTRYSYQFDNGMFYQYMRNVLQKNNGDGTFSEIGQLAGVSNTDWSWSPLLADYDNDGRKDLFVTNGYKHDNTNMEFMVYAADQSQHIQQGGKAPSIREYISHMPGISLPNYIFRNTGNDHFENKIKEWGLDQSTFSHGAAYADLDHDGDLDLVTNNTDDYAGIYQNHASDKHENSFLNIRLKGDARNQTAIGAKVYAWAGGENFYLEQSPVRGYQSSVDHQLHLGLGAIKQLDSIRVIWPDQTSQLLTNVAVNKMMVLSLGDAKPYRHPTEMHKPLLEETNALDFSHQENLENDFTRQFLLPHFYSHNGPCMTKGDVNGDGLDDLFIGGASGQPGAVFIQGRDGKFILTHSPALASDAESEDVDAAFFDADGDHDLDLYVVSGGYEFDEGSPRLQDRLYKNDGKGNFARSDMALYKNASNKTCVRPVDIDLDGDIDLFVGGGVIPGKFPLASPSKIYFNDGTGNFAKIKAGTAPLGIVNDAIWIDLDKDGKKDLIVAGEWMPLKAFLTHGALFKDVTDQWFPFASNGWWNCLASGDFDNDGDMDLVAGNYGLNSQLRADEQHPMRLYYPDIDGNGSLDPIITRFVGNDSVPMVLRDDLIGQVPILKKKFNDYPSYARAGIADILTPDQLKNAPQLTTNLMKTIYLENTGTKFVIRELPLEAQFAPVYSIAAGDLNHDGNKDLVLTGNNTYNRIYVGRQDANHGIALLGDGRGHFRYITQAESGLRVRGDTRSSVITGDQMLFGVNNSKVTSYRIR